MERSMGKIVQRESHKRSSTTATSGKECISCGQVLGQSKSGCEHYPASHVKLDWEGLPAGVRFDPSDEELLEHLAAKIGRSSKRAHPLLDDFIHTLLEEDGICRTHPENLPDVKKDGSSCHYFHRPSMAYTTGTRKRRKIQTDDVVDGGADVRWHKTGKTRPVSQGGKILGFKKIMVLYKAAGKKSKNLKTNWVMHQYHLGTNEEETDGELVVCKVFFQKAPRSCPSRKTGAAADDEDCEPSESDIGFQEPTAVTGLSGDSPSVSAVTRGMPPVTPKSFASSRTAKQLYAEPTESISEIFDPQALATQSKQKSTLAGGSMLQYNESVAVDMNQSVSGSLAYKPQIPGVELETALYADNQATHVMENVSCEGEDETVNLNEEYVSWDIDQIMDDPSVGPLLCNERLNGDPLVQDAAYADFNMRSCAYDVGCSLEEEEHFRGDTGFGGEKIGLNSLNDLMLDTPPDLNFEGCSVSQLPLETPPDMNLEYPSLSSQDVRDIIGSQNPFPELDNTDSQSTT